MSQLKRHHLYHDSALLNYWPLVGNSNDHKASNHGTDTSMSYSQGGKFEGYANFSGSGYISFGNINNFERTDIWSVSVWFKHSDVQGAIIGKQKATSQFNGWYLGTFVGGPLRWGMTDSAGGVLYGDISSNYPDNQWHHAVGTYDGSQLTSGLLLYIDGKNVALSYVNTLGASIQTAFNLQVGAREGANFLYTGSLTDVAIWNRVLAADEIRSLYNSHVHKLQNKLRPAPFKPGIAR